MLADAPLGAGQRLMMKVSPNIAFAPANLIVRATIERNVENRYIELVAESEDFYRSSEVQLDGDAAPQTVRFEFRALPSGSYIVRATLKGADERPIANVRQEVNVMEAGGSD